MQLQDVSFRLAWRSLHRPNHSRSRAMNSYLRSSTSAIGQHSPLLPQSSAELVLQLRHCIIPRLLGAGAHLYQLSFLSKKHIKDAHAAPPFNDLFSCHIILFASENNF